MTELINLSLSEARQGLGNGDFSALDLTKAYLAAIEHANPRLNCYVAVTADLALEMAAASDQRIARNEAGPLEGMPLAIKDLFCTKGIHSQACSKILEGFKPTYESTVTANLWRDGAVMLGKANMDEFAMGSSNENSCYGPAINPWRAQDSDQDLVPGGSSGGSAAAVSARLCVGATATDTGGSIRQPASYTGTVGIRPTYGRCSRWGMMAFASSLDQAGPMARTVKDTAILLGSMAGYDPKDSTSVDRPVPDYAAATEKSVKGIRVGIPKEYRVENMPGDIEALWKTGEEWLRDAGAEIVHVSMPHTHNALPAYYIIGPAEASSNLARYDGIRYGLRVDDAEIAEAYAKTRAAGFGPEVKRRVLMGTYVLSAGYFDAYYRQAQRLRSMIKDDFDQAFNQVDVLLTPATPCAAFEVGARAADPISMYLDDIFTVPVNMAGLGGLAVPAGRSETGLPLGLQLIGRPFDEETLFQVGARLEEAAGIFPMPPRWW